MIAAIARLLEGVGTIAVGAASPIPGAASLLARAKSKGRTRVLLLGSRRHNDFTEYGWQVLRVRFGDKIRTDGEVTECKGESRCSPTSA